jgi:hypothetical protein
MAWNIEVVHGCAVVRMNTYKVNVHNDQFFATGAGRAVTRCSNSWARDQIAHRHPTLTRKTAPPINAGYLKGRFSAPLSLQEA